MWDIINFYMFGKSSIILMVYVFQVVFLTDSSVVWHDLTEEHKELRERLELAVERFINTTESIYMPVIIAPYGSGKTTLFKYLTWWCWNKKRIPAIHTNFSAIVEFIKSKGYSEQNKVSEDRIYKIIEEFFNRKINKLNNSIRNKQLDEALKILREEFLMLKSTEDPLKYLGISTDELLNILSKNYGVIFFDEIEESYNFFKSLVIYETSPLRGIADAIYERRTNLLMFFAYGPSTIAAEAISKATLWRVEEHTIPIVDPRYVLNLLEKEIHAFRDLFLQNTLLAYGLINLVWWLSKGRPAWVNKFVRSDFLLSLIKTLASKSLKDLSGNLGQILISEAIRDTSPLTGEIIGGVRPFEYESFQKHFYFLRSEADRKLFITSICLLTPLPEDTLSELCNLTVIPRSNWLFSSKELVNVAVFADCLSDEVEQILREIIKIEPSAISLLKKQARWVTKILSEAVANQHHEILFSPDYITELLEAISIYAQELYINNPELSDAISRVNSLSLLSKIRKKEPQAIRSTETIYYSISPRILLEVFPPLMAVPLIGKAKKISERELFDHFVGILEESDRLFDTFEKITELLLEGTQIQNPPLTMFLPIRILKDSHEIVNKMAARLIGENSVRYILLFTVGGSPEELQDMEKFLSDELKGLMDLGVLMIEHLPPRLGLFLLSLFYNLSNQGPSFVEDLSDFERMIYNSYKRSLYWDYILPLMREVYQKNAETNRHLESAQSIKSLAGKLDEIARRSHADIGSGHAERIVSNAYCPEGLEFLANLAVPLKKLYDALEKLNEENVVKFDIDKTFKEIKQFVLTKGHFVVRVKEVVELFDKALDECNIFKRICLALANLLAEKIREGEKIDRALKMLKCYMDNIRIFKGYFAQLVNSFIIYDAFSRLDKGIRTYFSKDGSVISFIHQYYATLNTLHRNLYACVEEIKKAKNYIEECKKIFNLKIELNDYHLIKQLNRLEDFLEECQSIVDELRSQRFPKPPEINESRVIMLKNMLLDGDGKGVVQHVREGLNYFAEAAYQICQDVLQKVSLLFARAADIAKEHEDIKDSLSKDLLEILSRDLKDAANSYEEIQILSECLAEIRRLRSRINTELQDICNMIVSKLNQLLEKGGLKE